MNTINSASLSNTADGTGMGQWLRSMPEATISRLRYINGLAGSANHVIASLTIGLKDKNIAKLNRIIITLLLKRMQAERRGSEHQIQKINRIMSEIHDAIDTVTGINRTTAHSTPCNQISATNRFKKMSA